MTISSRTRKNSLTGLLGTTTLAAVLLALLISGTATAQLPGTLFGLVQDENENPVADAEITITDPESPDFKQVESTDAKGKYRLFIANATKPYTLTIVKQGHQPLTLNGVKVSARQRTRRNFTLRTATAAPTVDTSEAASGGSGANGLFNRGVTAMNAGDLDSAESMFKQALEQKPDLANANAALARLYLQRELYEDAASNAGVAVTAGIDLDSMNQVLYRSYTELGEKEKAQEILAKMQSADPSKANKNLFNEAADLYNSGDMAGAKPLLEQVLSTEPNHPKANYMMGLIYAGEQVNDKAKMHLEKFIELAPNDPDAALAKEMLTYLE